MPMPAAHPVELAVRLGEARVESSCVCEPFAPLKAYRVLLQPDAGRVVLEGYTERFYPIAPPPSPVLSVDEFEGHLPRLPRAASRVKRELVSALFPRLFQRMRSADADAPSALRACLLEVRARRVVPDWTLDGLDATGNLSSLGLSILLALLLRYWCGCSARVHVSRTGGALVGVHSEGNAYLHVDPASTCVNAFELAPDMMPLLESGVEHEWRKGDFAIINEAQAETLVRMVKHEEGGMYSVKMVDRDSRGFQKPLRVDPKTQPIRFVDCRLLSKYLARADQAAAKE